MKGIAERALASAGIYGCRYIAQTQNPTFHPGRTAEIVKDDTVLGIIGEVHPEVCKEFGLGAKTYLAILDFDRIFDNASTEKEYTPLPKFPATTRDLALICPKDLTVAEITDIIELKAKGILESVKLFDVYSGAQIPEGFISLAFALVFRANDRTLNDDEIDGKMKKIVKSLAEIGAEIRS
jgi:phenylalanyl-tRNA synthetase beta chain